MHIFQIICISLEGYAVGGQVIYTWKCNNTSCIKVILVLSNVTRIMYVRVSNLCIESLERGWKDISGTEALACSPELYVGSPHPPSTRSGSKHWACALILVPGISLPSLPKIGLVLGLKRTQMDWSACFACWSSGFNPGHLMECCPSTKVEVVPTTARCSLKKHSLKKKTLRCRAGERGWEVWQLLCMWLAPVLIWHNLRYPEHSQGYSLSTVGLT